MQVSFLNQWFTSDIMKALSWTFVHSLWQGLLAALLAAVIISSTRKATARLRYNLLGSVLLLFLATAVITFFNELKHTTSSIIPVAAEAGTEQFVITASNDTATSTLSNGLITDLAGWFNNHANLFMLAWALFFLLNSVKLVAGLASIHRLRHYKTHPVTDEWKTKLSQLCDRLGIRQSVRLLQSELVKVPVALGFFKPVILLPVGLLANIPPDQVETILLHELSHIRRRDYLVNFLQHFAEAIFFFNPAMLWISSLVRQEREACCDDIVVANTGQKRNYLNALVAFQEYSLRHTPYVMGIGSRKQYLLNRVKRMVTNENKKLNLLEKFALLSGLVLFSAFTFISQEEKEKVNEVVITALTEKLPAINELSGPVIQNTIAKSAIEPVKKAKAKVNPTDKQVTDTVPAKKEKPVPVVNDKSNKTLPSEKDWENAAAKSKKKLEEIEKIKKEIGEKKESIGIKKEQLKSKEGKEKERLEQEIKKERVELESKREKLEKQRDELEGIKKQSEKEKEKEALRVKIKRSENELEGKRKDIIKKRVEFLNLKKQSDKEKDKEAFRKKIGEKEDELERRSKEFEKKRAEFGDLKNQVNKDKEILRKKIGREDDKDRNNKLFEKEQPKIEKPKKNQPGREKDNGQIESPKQILFSNEPTIKYSPTTVTYELDKKLNFKSEGIKLDKPDFQMHNNLTFEKAIEFKLDQKLNFKPTIKQAEPANPKAPVVPGKKVPPAEKPVRI